MEKSDWHAWRANGLGASDSPIIMDVSPWKTRFQLWEEKTGMKTAPAGNWATDRGNDLEPKARAHYELVYNRDMPIAFVENKDFPFIRASLDGFNEKENIILEIKCPGAADHAKAIAGEIPEKYYPQLQHQLLASGAKLVHYYSFDGENGALVEVAPDFSYMKKLALKLEEFWRLVQTKNPPLLSDRDYKLIRGNTEIKALSTAWADSKSQLDAMAETEKRLKTELTAAIDAMGDDHGRFRIGDVRVAKQSRVGNVDYKKIPELKGIDLEKYRGKPSSFWVCRVSASSDEN